MIDRALIFIEEQTELYFQGLPGPSSQNCNYLGNIARISDRVDHHEMYLDKYLNLKGHEF